jgi:enoyl-CoA hydratase/carnithine racemase|tara:strand:+ start:2908 stop:3072 length:165 start_codon:yes stop_codon:yes gene_type:complete
MTRGFMTEERGAEVGLETGLALDASIHQRRLASENRREGVDAFNGKRKPEWRFR